jgi:hypothetical protein
MRRVEVPDRLRSVLLSRLAQQQDTLSRKPLRRYLSLAAGIAAVLLVGWGTWFWFWGQLPPISDAIDQAYYVMNFPDNPSPREDIQDYFRKLGYDVRMPDDLNFDYLVAKDLRLFPGQNKVVPCLVFRQGENKPQSATVFLVTNKQFDLSSLKAPPDDDGYRIKVKVHPRENNRQTDVIFYTGNSLEWLTIKQDNGPAQAI